MSISLPLWMVIAATLLLLALLGIALYLFRLARQYQQAMDLAEERARRIQAQFKAPDWHPDHQHLLQRTPDEMAMRYERLRKAYNQLYERHKQLVTAYQRIQKAIERARLAGAPTPKAEAEVDSPV